MLKNYITSAIRNLLKHKFYSIINILGLAVGIAVCLLILLYVQDELSYDKYNKKADRIYRLAGDFIIGGNKLNIPITAAIAAKTMINDFPEVENATRIRTTGGWFVKYGEKTIKEESLAFVDSTFFDVFTIPLIAGNPKTALTEPYTLVLSQKTVDKLFGSEDPLGKIIRLDNSKDYKVTGVFKEIPANSHFHFEILASLTTREDSRNPVWLSMNYYTYLLLNENTDWKKLESKFPDLIARYMGPEFEMFLGKSLDQFKKEGGRAGFYLQPLKDIHLYSTLGNDIEPNSDIKYIYIFSAVAFFILLIACINFMNLSTARSAGRAKEVGIRKVLGSEKKQLIKQFLTESVVMSFIAMFIGIILIILLMPYFNELSGKSLEISIFTNTTLITGIVSITVFIGLLAGSYPALFISSFQPVKVLSGKMKSGAKSGWLRSSLVVFQFAASILMMIGTIVVFNQLNYIQNKNLGFNKEQIIIINDTFILGKQADAFKDEVLQNPVVLSGTVSGNLPVRSDRSNSAVFKDAKKDDKTMTPMQMWYVDHDYIKTMGMEIIAGRDFSREFGTDSNAVIINETAAKHFGWENPLNQKVGAFSGIDPPVLKAYTIIGVVKNFHFDTFKNSIEPLIFFLSPYNDKISFRINTGNIASVLDYMKNVWDKFAPGQPFDYSFMDEKFADYFQSEQKVGQIASTFAVIAVFVGCLGLFGLAAFTAEQRTKEIGVRKVMGATVGGLVVLLAKEFAKLVAVAFVIAAPIGYFYMNSWLQDFYYRTEISLNTFLLAGILAFVIAMITVSYHAIRIALLNPVKSLRYE